jgi:hypothetical protein
MIYYEEQVTERDYPSTLEPVHKAVRKTLHMEASKNHCDAVGKILEQFDRTYKFKCITDKKIHDRSGDRTRGYRETLPICDKYGNPSHYPRRDGCIGAEKRTLPLSESFIEIKHNLVQNLYTLSEEEMAHFVKKVEYQRIPNSKIMNDFITHIEKLKGEGWSTSDGLFSLDTITHSSYSNIHFQFWVYNGLSSHDDGYDYYHTLNLLSNSYRSISLEELSMLACALNKKYPELFGIGWECFISEFSALKWYIYPYWRKRRTSPVVNLQYNDIYNNDIY